MKYLLIINTTETETVWNALRFSSAALSRGHEVSLFLLGPAVEIERIGDERFDVQNDRLFDLSATAARLQSLNLPLLDLIANLGSVFIIWYGGSLVVRGELTLGELVAFSTYMGLLIQPVRRLGMILPNLATAIAAAPAKPATAPAPVAAVPSARPAAAAGGYG